MSPPAAKKAKEENGSADANASEAREVTLFREYLRIKSVHPNPDYDGTNAFLKRMAGELGLPCRIVEMVEGKPIFLMEWKGTDPSLPALLLNSHTDVVPVFEEFWKCDPFAAIKDEKGDIYCRGSEERGVGEEGWGTRVSPGVRVDD